MIPKKPMGFDPARLTIDQTIMLAEFAQSKQVDIGVIAALKTLLVECTDWSEAEIGRIRLGEFATIFDQMRQKNEEEQSEAINPPIGSSSDSTAQTLATNSPPGQQSSNSPKSGAAHRKRSRK